MASEDVATIDFLLQDLGGCGLFQYLMTGLVYGSLTSGAWAIMFMAFGVYSPGWRCASDLDLSSLDRMSKSQHNANTTRVTEWVNGMTGFKTSCEGFSSCQKVVYSHDSSTLVSEWNLGCDNFYILSSIISIQMAGGLAGTFVIGILNNWLGRKPSHYLTLSCHALFHLVMAFSPNWQMFAVFAFFSGLTSGSLLVTTFLYSVEFVIPKCRSIVAGLPMWTLGCLTFSITAMILRDWRHIQLAIAILSLVSALPAFFTPESMRWLAINGKIEKAQRVGRKIAKVNHRDEPNMDVLTVIAEEEAKTKRDEGRKRITILDLYRCQFLKATLTTTLFWTNNTIVYYGIVYGVKSLSGDFYVNLMLTTTIATVSYPLAPVFANNLGRKFGMVFFMFLATICLITMIVMDFYPLRSHNGLVQLILTFVVLSCIDGEWCVSLTYTAELFPTALRSLGFSHASAVARLGGMVAPFLVPTDESSMYISRIFMACLIFLTATAILFLPETNKREMNDSMTGSNKPDPDRPLDSRDIIVDPPESRV